MGLLLGTLERPGCFVLTFCSTPFLGLHMEFQSAKDSVHKLPDTWVSKENHRDRNVFFCNIAAIAFHFPYYYIINIQTPDWWLVMLFHHFLVLLFQTKISKWLILTDFDRRLSNRLSENKPDTMTMPDRISKNMTTKLSVFMLIECPAAGIDHSKYEVGRFHIFCRLGKTVSASQPTTSQDVKIQIRIGLYK